MANNDSIEPNDINNRPKVRKSSDLLPGYHRTEKNVKFLSSTLDQYIQEPQLERIDGFIGSKLSPNYNPKTDTYIDGKGKLRTDYQLEPALVVKDNNFGISKAYSYDDLINQLKFSGANVDNLNRLLSNESYSYDPCIDWDKFVNFRQYYWLPNGPDTVEVTGVSGNSTVTYSVTDSKDGLGLIFDAGTGISETLPLLTLYRGTPYTFNVSSQYPFYIKTAYVAGPQSLYSGASNQGTQNGQVVLNVDDFTPNTLFYFAEGNEYAVGQIVIKQADENTFLNVEQDILGKLEYTSGNGIKFTNGLKIKFIGNVLPEYYLDKEFIVEGVGTSITLVDFDSLKTVGQPTTQLNPNFDASPFDKYPFDDFTFLPLTPEYITINKASPDLNPWSRYNRWVHEDVITVTAQANGSPPVYPADQRAQRPIIEFIAGLQLYNFGSKSKRNVDLIDNITLNAFGLFEKSPGFFIDGVEVEPGFRVIFNADQDPLVRGRVFNVNFVIVDGKTVVDLELAEDSEPDLLDSVVATRGKNDGNSNWWFDGKSWIRAQQKTEINQFPLFELFDNDGNKFSDRNFYNSSFAGTKVFSYMVGTGSTDPVLGFPLKYRNIANVGDYLFENNFMTDKFSIFDRNNVTIENVSGNYLKVNGTLNEFRNVWKEQSNFPLPILQYQVIETDINYVQISVIDDPGFTSDLRVDLFINDIKMIEHREYRIYRDQERAYVVSTSGFKENDRVLLKIYTSKVCNPNGYYEVPVNLTNNPLNGSIGDFTFTEVSDHVKSIANNLPNFVGKFPGSSNLRDIGNVNSYGSRLVSHENPMGFAHFFLGSKENNLIDAVRQVAFDYNQFKSALIKKLTDLRSAFADNAPEILDLALTSLNSNKDSTFAYNFSDMLAYGKDYKERIYTVTDSRNTKYSIESVFNSTLLSERSVLVYLNGELLVKGRDYNIDQFSPSIEILTDLSPKDQIRILDFPTTVGSYVPPTPTKLGLYPKFTPEIYVDNTYSTGPRTVIQGHDGSLTVAYGDFRDDVLLEFEKRVYNNLKIEYDSDLFDIFKVNPGAFRNNEYSLGETNEVIVSDFLKWTGFFGVDYQSNTVFDETNSFTFNHSEMVDRIGKRKLPGYWRAIYRFFFDTDRPHTHPWEMLGFSEKPSWWESKYGPAPYTRGNLVLWKDLESGYIDQGSRAGNDIFYARPGLLDMIPVDDSGNLLSPTDCGLAFAPVIDPNDPPHIVNLRSQNVDGAWKFGDQAPAETAWRRSSYWPFAMQVLAALTKPASYAAKMFDTSRLKKNSIGQYKYTETKEFLRLSDLLLFRDVVSDQRVLASGYSVFVVETGLNRDTEYLIQLKSNLKNVDYNLMAKLGGFASKDKLQITIDAVDPDSPYSGVLLPSEDYEIFFNQSTPIDSLSISGMIIQKTRNGYAIRGYDKYSPYFTIHAPFISNADSILTVGGKSQKFVVWSEKTTYDEGDIVFYLDRYYRVKQKHNSGEVFTLGYYQSLPNLPQTGGISVQKRSTFDLSETIIPYGVEYSTIQEVYDLIVGYGHWLESKGFIFDEFNEDLSEVIDWNFTAKEFLFWTTQNWSENSVITLSPFANRIQFYSDFGVVDNIVNKFYEYSLLRADGAPFPTSNFSISRIDGTFKLSTLNTTNGLFFARLNLVQKEHALLFKNYTLFNDVVYDTDTGYRQRRVKIKGFRTSNWNGDLFSPGFIFDQAKISDWERFTDYTVGQVVRFSGKYYSAPNTITGSNTFNFDEWVLLRSKPTSQLFPNFDYKINQFEDFYSLDIDNFDASQQAMAQHLIGYTPRPYLSAIIGDATAQYKFYQGFIKEKGTKNPLRKLTKSTLNNYQSSIDFNEEWAFRIGSYGGFNTYQELEFSLDSTKFIENPQIIKLVSETPLEKTNTIYYKNENSIIIKPDNFNITQAFPTAIDNTSIDDFPIPVAGYVRFDDITVTAFNKNSILDIANNQNIVEGSTVWLGFKENGDWDVLRYSAIPTYISNVSIFNPGQAILLTTAHPHQLSVGDIISVVSVESTIDRVYIVNEVVSPTEFVVFSTLFALPDIPNPLNGLIYVFKSSRIDNISELHTLPYLEQWKPGDKVWVDNTSENAWSVLEKVDNFNSFRLDNSVTNFSQFFGTEIFASESTSTVLVSAPNFIDRAANILGRVFVMSKDQSGLDFRFSYSLNKEIVFYNSTATNGFGKSLVFDPTSNLSIVGAPDASNVGVANSSTVIITSGIQYNNYESQGLVKLSVLDIAGLNERASIAITTPFPSDESRFGEYLDYSTKSKLLLVSSVGYNQNQGAVYVYKIDSVTSSTIDISHRTSIFPNEQGTYFGSSLSGNDNLNRIAISSPMFKESETKSSGAVHIYSFNTATYVATKIQTLTGNDDRLPYKFSPGETFGSVVKMTSDGNYLVVGSPYSSDPERGTYSGLVDIYKWESSDFVFHQRIHSPIPLDSMNFGYNIEIDESGEELVISLKGNAKAKVPTFDIYTDRLNQTESVNQYGTIYINDPLSKVRKQTTTFDNGATGFYQETLGAGSAHVYYRTYDYYSYGQELSNKEIDSNSTFGNSIAVTNDTVYIGAPALTDQIGNGEIFIFDKKDSNIKSWKNLRKQESLVDLSVIKTAKTINTTDEQIDEYLNIIDPIKGKILGTAQQELRYISPYDPAIYSVGIEGVNTNVNSNWVDEHIGELWWDLSSVKFVWYEQGELEYRRNNWNTLFPGCSIDVYEWVGSELLPSEWSRIADTSDGLARGISGQPRFPDNSVMSVKQVYNKVSNSFVNIYYYWVKNKNILPNGIKNRRIPAYQVALQIADPLGSGNKFVSILSPDSVMLANAKPEIRSDNINLSFTFDYEQNSANRHTEWMLMQENDPNSRPNWLLEKKLIDSVLGHDSVGNLVPDPLIPAKLKYGIEIRPRQSMFVNRFEALRNIIEFVNEIMTVLPVTGRVDFTNLNSKDELPAAIEYDIAVEDVFALELVPTTLLQYPELKAVIDSNGFITGVEILNSGYGYITPPTIKISGDGTGAYLESVINEKGQIIAVNVVESGRGYTTAEISARPFTSVILTDLNIGGKWSVNEWNYTQKQWLRVRTQEFDTTLYWKYRDWVSKDYDSLAEIMTTVGSVYALDAFLSLPEGSYVKVMNGGDGRYLILRRTNGQGGTFDYNWDQVYIENGTIRFLDSLWDLQNSDFGWDENTGFDQTLYDQAPDREISNIFTALKDDIFVSEYKIYWNQLFFKAVKYALSEQKNLDWAFKTTFISVTNSLGTLDQKNFYKVQNSKHYEDFLKEIKPYHTKIRKFTEAYTRLEPSNTFVSDFDLPTYYNTQTYNFGTVDFGNDLLLQYPWKSWYNNFTYGVESIDIYDSGESYSYPPVVTILPAMGDTGFGATAVAYISFGKISRIEVTNPGQGYTTAPAVILTGGGSLQTVPAKAYAILGNNPVRKSNIRMKFDRISTGREIGNQTYKDTFIGNGERVDFDLSWVPVADKTDITLTVNGVLQMLDSYTIEFYTQQYSLQSATTYTKKFAKLKLFFIPNEYDVIEITYPKSLELYNAIDRIEDYYQPSSGMPGKELDQLMSGLSYSGLQIDTEPLDIAGGWDATPYGSTNWDNYAVEEGYISFSTSATTTQTFIIENLVVPQGIQINTYIDGIRVDDLGSLSYVPTYTSLGTAAIDRIEIQSPGLGYTSTFVSVSISAPNNLNGVAATGQVQLNSDGSISQITITNPGSGYTEPPIVTVIGSNKIQAYAKAIIKSEFTSTVSTASQTALVIPSSAFAVSSSTERLVVFRYYNSDGTLTASDLDSLDSVISGGTIDKNSWQLVGALGISPSEIILDGGSASTRHITGMSDDGFLNSTNSPAPEECVPGQIQEAVGISVYTQPAITSPVIVTRKYYIDGSTSTFDLGLVPTDVSSVFVTFNNTKVNSDSYSVDVKNSVVTLNEVLGTGWLGFTTIQSGALGLLDYHSDEVTAIGQTYDSYVAFDSIGSNGTSVFVTIDGVPSNIDVDYTLTNNRGSAMITFNKTGFAQAYLMSGPVKSISQINEEIFVSTTSTSTFSLTYPPGNLAPLHSQVIVTKNGLRLNPPVTTYYQVENQQLTYNISQTIVYSPRTVGLQSLEVYVNGIRSPVPGKWRFNQADNTVSFSENTIDDGDVIAIVVKKDNDYLIENSQLVLTTPSSINDEYRIVTFTNHDPSFIRTERFKGHLNNEYRLQRPVLNPMYIWVSKNGHPLLSDLDYTVDISGYVIKVRSTLGVEENDDIVITSFASESPKLVAYRQFKDILGRTHFKRLSSDNTTELVENLYTTSTEIVVANSSCLTPPSVASNRPGVVLIDGERIEFFTVTGNVLGQLRRSTLGTTPKDVYIAGTPVIDQGANQTVPFSESIQHYTTATSTSSQYQLDGITLAAGISATDQVEVRYQGRILLKPNLLTVKHNNEISYDSTSTADTVVVPDFTITTSTNTLNLAFTPVPGAKLEVIRRISSSWYNVDSPLSLSENNTVPVKFLLERSASLPDKYRYGQE